MYKATLLPEVILALALLCAGNCHEPNTAPSGNLEFQNSEWREEFFEELL